jgi:hypothetical protein
MMVRIEGVKEETINWPLFLLVDVQIKTVIVVI